ncbi:3-oxoadipate enol-lactonase [Trinickia caryophylli]|uniref:3-oxoadipate enol-lactonase n=1 Tax=Trinickia caryophylli TaxID=28094 RepID=A0A1X7FN92_TRICW|nr:3-oxoadipate enol-lactonase [Trinickia caryophylli]PMS13862.1 3-oxoadipate enol-lactonase [Trinickia caryophylli]TRX14358.1 3-oxoadipate enol-lactonase [Trinickia caryophylli]WQE14193.1 3-oxoadipate enol-lactonase [Trinickia caryophylli]SMF55397.1 3-oxoadipate enol-lactonase [Trinickia caryophylli]GLU33303.1 3-oxoadipate enol-lactonase [Trinickia caryophylli]
MPFATIEGVRLYYRVDANGPADAPWLVLSNALACDTSLWAPQVDALGAVFRVLRYDTRGHGRSEVPAGPYTIEQLSDDVLALMDLLEIGHAHFCGVSMGGVTGMALGARAAERIDRLVLVSAPPRNPTPAEAWEARMKQARTGGMPAIAQATIERWFSTEFIEREPLVCAAIRDTVRHTDPEGYVANCAAIAAADLTDEVADIEAPTLVVTGTRDATISAEQGRALAARMARARHLAFDALHLPNVEQAAPFTHAVLDFLRGA